MGSYERLLSREVTWSDLLFRQIILYAMWIEIKLEEGKSVVKPLQRLCGHDSDRKGEICNYSESQNIYKAHLAELINWWRKVNETTQGWYPSFRLDWLHGSFIILLNEIWGIWEKKQVLEQRQWSWLNLYSRGASKFHESSRDSLACICDLNS